MYFGPGWKGGHESMGVTAPATSWFLAEGATGMFSEWVLVGNPNDTPRARHADVPAGVGAGDRARTRHGAQQPPDRARAGRGAGLDERRGLDEGGSDVPVIAERAMYWPAADWGEAHNSFGVTETATKWGLAEGRVGGPLQLRHLHPAGEPERRRRRGAHHVPAHQRHHGARRVHGRARRAGNNVPGERRSCRSCRTRTSRR